MNVRSEGRPLWLLIVGVSLTVGCAVATTGQPALSAVFGALSLAMLFVARRWIQQLLDEQAAQLHEVTESEHLSRATVDSLLDGIVIQDEEGRVVRSNQAARRMMAAHLGGATPARGEAFSGFLPEILDEGGQPFRPEDRPVARALAGPDPVVGLIAALPTAAGLVWFRCNATAIEDTGGRGRRVVLTFANITTERRLATKLADHERRFRLALEHAPIGMALVSLKGELLTVNSALCELTGWTRDELEYYGLFALAHPDDPPYGVDDLQRLAASHSDSFTGVHRFVDASGQTVHVRVSMSVVRSNDDEPYFIVEFLDITASLRAAEAQQSALEREQEVVAQLVALDDARTTFVSTVSHELRTPLTSLVGYLELLDDGTAGELTEPQQKMVAASVRNGQRLRRLIDDLMTITVAERRETAERDGEVAIDELIADVVEAMSPLADDAGVTLLIEIGDTDVVRGDATDLERVLINLVGNAVKFTPTGGTVTIRSRTRSGHRGGVEISVCDTGVGIPAHEQDQLFSRFFRTASARQNHVPGTGLGLAIVAKLVDAHRGQISVSSVEHQGTTFTILLPRVVTRSVATLESA